MPTKIPTADAAEIAGCSPATLRKKLVPVEVVETHVHGRGVSYAYLYSRRDVERLRDGLPIRKRKHPDDAVARTLKQRGQQAALVISTTKAVIKAGQEMPIWIPADTPTCCMYHAVNHVRHVGCNYESVLAMRSSVRGRRSSSDVGYGELKETLNHRITMLLIASDFVVQDVDCFACAFRGLNEMSGGVQ